MKFLVKWGWSVISFVLELKFLKPRKCREMPWPGLVSYFKLITSVLKHSLHKMFFLQYRHKVVHILATYSMSSKSWCVYQVHRLSFCDMSASVPAAFEFWMCKDHPVWTDHGVLDVRNIYNIVKEHQFAFCSFINWVSSCCKGIVLAIISVTLNCSRHNL